MQTHTFPVRFLRGRSSLAQWSIRPARAVIVFVHGFGGSSETTWNAFPEMLPGLEACAEHDIIVYDYDSLSSGAGYSSAKLANLMRELLVDPLPLINSEIPQRLRRNAPFGYQRVILVAHSLGAVVARRALLDLARDRKLRNLMQKIRLLLFAPAHMGGDIIRLAAQALSVIKLVPVEPMLKFFWPTLKDLEPGSVTLAQLAKHTEDALRQTRADETSHLIAASVMHAQNDRIVNQNQFCRDPALLPIDGRGHSDVCKPSSQYLQPLNELLACL